MYGDNTQDTAQFSVPPFNRFEIIISGKDRSVGEFFPEIEGDFFYVERSDYMASAYFVAGGNADVRSGLTLREGLKIKGAFKGVYLTHPSISVGTPSAPQKIVIWTSKNAEFENGLNTFSTRYCSAVSSSMTTAQAQITCPVPDGARFVDFTMMVDVDAASQPFGTVTLRPLNYVNGGSILPGATNKINALTQVVSPYSGQPACGRVINAAFVSRGGTRWICQIAERDIPLPFESSAFAVTLTFDVAVTANNTNVSAATAYFK